MARLRRITIVALLVTFGAASLAGWRYWQYRQEVAPEWPRVASISGLCGLIDRDGAFVVNPQYDEIYISGNDEWIAVKRDGKFGFIDSRGNVRVPRRYDIAYPPVKANPDKEWGQPIIGAHELFGFLSPHNEEISPIYLAVKADPHGGLQRANAYTLFTFDKRGIALAYKAKAKARSDANQRLSASEWDSEWRTMEQSAQPVFVNRAGKELITLDYFDAALPFNGGDYAPVRKRSSQKWGMINRAGKLVIQPRFDLIGPIGEARVTPVRLGKSYRLLSADLRVVGPAIEEVPEQFLERSIFEEQSLVPVRISGKWGYLDQKGNIAISPQFDEAGLFFDSPLANVRVGDKWGYIDRNGKFRVNPRFDAAYPFVGAWAPVGIGSKWGFVLTSGKVIEPAFVSFSLFQGDNSDRAAVQVDLRNAQVMGSTIDQWGRTLANSFGTGSWALIDQAGHLIGKTRFERIAFGGVAFSHYLPVKIDGKWGFVDKRGKQVISPQFDSIDTCREPFP